MDDAVLSGKVVGQSGRQYRLGERLGAGGWGSVYAGVQVELGRPVAIKILHKDVAHASDGLLRFEREARSAAALGHPNIAQVSDFQANPGEPPFLVMELLTGATLGTTLRGAPMQKLTVPRMAWIAYQMLAGLDVAHRAGIVHRDIKPDNVFLVAMPGVEDYVKLLDFGIAKLAGDASSHLTTTGTMLGSPAFMAPEQIKSNAFDHRVDLYAVGGTMYLALAGRPPFDAPNVHGLLLAITEQRAVPLHVLDPSIDPAMSALVERAMSKDPNGRLASAGEMRAALEPWLGGMAAHMSATANAARPSPSAPPTVAGAPPMTTQALPQSRYAVSVTPATAPQSPYGPPPMSPPPMSPPMAHGYAVTPPGNAYASAGPPAQYGAPPQPYMSPAMAPVHGAPRAKSGGAVIGLLVFVVVLLVLIIGGGIAGFLYYSSSASPVAVAPVASGAAGAASAAGAAGAATTAAAATAAPGATTTAVAAGGAGAPKPGAPAVKAGVAAPGSPAAGAPGAAAGAGAAGAAPVAIVADAGAAGAAKKQFAGSSGRIGGGSFGVFDIEASKTAIGRVMGSVNACYAANEFDAPDHQFTNWTFQVDPAGNVKSVGRTTDFQAHPKFDPCMIGALRQVKWPVTPAGGSPQVAFTSRTRDNP